MITSTPRIPREKPHRAPWRQRLIDMETGLRIGLRADSTLFVDLFVGSAVIITGAILGLSVLQWAIITLALGTALSAEIFHQLLKQLTTLMDHHLPRQIEQIMQLGSAALMVSNVTSLLVVLIVFGHRISQFL